MQYVYRMDHQRLVKATVKETIWVGIGRDAAVRRWNRSWSNDESKGNVLVVGSL